jgi:rhomboid protease GluP
MITNTPLSSITMIIILLMFLICVGTQLSRKHFNLSVIDAEILIMFGANMNILVNNGQIYRLVTAIFLHAGAMHLFGNSISFFLYLMPV